MYVLYNSFGFRGIYILILIMASLIAIVFFNILLKNNNGLVFSFIVSITVMYLSKTLFAARNQIFSFLLFMIEIYCLNGLVKIGAKRYFWYLLVDAFLLVTFHDTVYPLFFVMIMPYLAEVILSKIFKLENSYKLEYSNLKNRKYLVILTILALIIGLFTPMFGTAYTNLVNCMNGMSTDFINELQTVNIFEYYSLTFYAFATIAILCFTKTKVKVKDILFVFGFLIFSFIAARNIFFMYLIGTIFFVNIINSFLNTYIEEDVLKKLDNSKLLIIIISCFILILSIKNFSIEFTKEYVHDYTYPIEATEWILENVDYENMRIWNSFNWGSYLELNGIKVFIDSRSGMYTEQENKNCTVLSDWYSVYKGAEKYEKIFEKYNITHVLVENKEIVNKYLSDDENYEMLYQDNSFTFYERKNAK